MNVNINPHSPCDMVFVVIFIPLKYYQNCLTEKIINNKLPCSPCEVTP